MPSSKSEKYHLRRIQRCESWIKQANTFGEKNKDIAYICWWIAFNSLYCYDDENPKEPKDRKRQEQFFRKINSRDGEKRINHAIYELERYSDSIETLVGNKFAFELFWRKKNRKYRGDWGQEFADSKTEYESAFNTRKTEKILYHLFGRLYVLRNQIMHGGATWNSHRNRDSLDDGWEILKFLVPVFLDIIKKNPDIDLGRPYYYADDK